MRLHYTGSLLGLLALAAPSATRAQMVTLSGDTNRTTIATTGQARQTVVPDHAVLTLLLEPQAMSVEEAASRLAAVERAVLDTLRRLNLPASAIQTFTSGVTPYRDRMSPSSGASFSGRSSIRVELSRLDQVPVVTSAALAKGATFVSPPIFTLAAADSVRRALIPQAFQQARRDAEAMAAAAGGRLGRLLDLGTGGSQAVAYAEQAQAQAMFVTNMMYDTGQRSTPNSTVSVTVTTRWLLVPGGR
jgi:uncharacterized protein YggE